MQACKFNALVFHQADEAYHIGPPQARESYLRMEKIIDVANLSGAQVGYANYLTTLHGLKTNFMVCSFRSYILLRLCSSERTCTRKITFFIFPRHLKWPYRSNYDVVMHSNKLNGP